MARDEEQLALVSPARKTKNVVSAEVAAVNPVARVIIDSPLPHLDRTFDYLVPESLDALAQPGVRIRVRFAGTLMDAWLVERVADSDHQGRLGRIEKVVSAEQVLSAEFMELVRAVADRWAGTAHDVLRTAVPARHARVEKEAPVTSEVAREFPAPNTDMWDVYGGVPDGRCVVAVAPHHSAIALAVQALAAHPTGGVIVVPDGRDVAVAEEMLRQCVPAELIAALTADLGPAQRYRRWLAVRRGQARFVVGTRSAAFAPVDSGSCFIIVDDGDDSHAELHAPYWHAREVLALRSHLGNAPFFILSHSRTAEAQLLTQGWARSYEAPRQVVRSLAPKVVVTGDDYEVARDPAAAHARIPSTAFHAIRRALAHGPVLLSVPRRGYVPRIACATCRASLACPTCSGPLELKGRSVPVCTRCGRLCGDIRCNQCSGTTYRALAIGSERTAEEIGRSFPNIPVRISSGSAVLDDVGEQSSIVIATPGAEPSAVDGFAAAVILDVRASLDRPDLRSGEETLRRWFDVSSRVRSSGEIIVVGDPDVPQIQSLVRWDPVGAAERELRDREQMKMTPAARTAELTGATRDVEAFVAALDVPQPAVTLGPVPAGVDKSRVYISVPRSAGPALASALKAAQASRSARKEGGVVSVRIDPAVIG